jgi:hypothetical protein
MIVWILNIQFLNTCNIKKLTRISKTTAANVSTEHGIQVTTEIYLNGETMAKDFDV